MGSPSPRTQPPESQRASELLSREAQSRAAQYTAMAEAVAQQVSSALEGLTQDVEKKHFRPAQKAHFLCSAKCCDSAGYGQMELQRCLQRCGEPVMQMEQIVTAQMGQFQERLQRCMVRCQDTAQEKLPSSPSDKQVAAAKSQMESCVVDCAKEYLGQVPKLRSDIAASVKKL